MLPSCLKVVHPTMYLTEEKQEISNKPVSSNLEKFNLRIYQ